MQALVEISGKQFVAEKDMVLKVPKQTAIEGDKIIYDKNKAKYNSDKILQKIYDESDIISLNINYDKSNYHFCDDSFISNFKKNIYIINNCNYCK